MLTKHQSSSANNPYLAMFGFFFLEAFRMMAAWWLQLQHWLILIVVNNPHSSLKQCVSCRVELRHHLCWSYCAVQRQQGATGVPEKDGRGAPPGSKERLEGSRGRRKRASEAWIAGHSCALRSCCFFCCCCTVRKTAAVPTTKPEHLLGGRSKRLRNSCCHFALFFSYFLKCYTWFRTCSTAFHPHQSLSDGASSFFSPGILLQVSLLCVGRRTSLKEDLEVRV